MSVRPAATERSSDSLFPAPAQATRRADRVRDHLRTPLNRDGYALAASSGFTAVTGLLYWIVAAKTYDPQAVGINSALISSMMFLAGIAGLNLPSIAVRFLPEMGERTRRAIAAAYLASAVVAVVAALVFVAGVSGWAPRLGFLRSDAALAAYFVLSTVAWCLFTVQDSVLTALGRAVWVPAENAAFALGKLGLLVVLAGTLPVYGIFVSWTLAMLVAVAVVNGLIFARLARGVPARPAGHAPPVLRDRAFGQYFAADYLCSVAWVSSTNLMPVIVLAASGPTTNAYYALAYAVALPLYALVLAVTTSLVYHGTRDPSALPGLVKQTARQGVLILIPLIAVLVAFAPQILSLFGPEYGQRSTGVMRLLAVGALPYLVIALALSAARVRRRLRGAVVALVGQAVLALGLAAPLLHAFGVTGAGVAWLTSLCVVAVGVVAHGIVRPAHPAA